MNIFFLDTDPALAAKYHCDKHVVKMVLESTQILCTVLNKKGITIPGQYAPTHVNHPCVLWAEKSLANFFWLLDLAIILSHEYTFRYKKTHACYDLLMKILGTDHLRTVRWGIPADSFTEPPQCMPDQYKNKNTVTAYRNYYKGEKARFAKWKYSTQPEWWLKCNTPEHIIGKHQKKNLRNAQ